MIKFESNYTLLTVKVTVIMKRIIIVSALFLISNAVFGQKINGQWRGFFDSKGDITLKSGENTEYVLEIEVDGSKINGYSYSYFYDRKYYVICSLSGTYYKSTNSMKVTETARIKGFTPPDWIDCLQTHILTYEKTANTEELKGRWVTGEGKVPGCGSGMTTLTRRTLSKDLASYNKSKGTTPFSKQAPARKTVTKIPLASNKKPVPPPVVKNTVKPKVTTSPVAKSNVKSKAIVEAPVKVNPVQKDIPQIITPEIKKNTVTVTAPELNFEKRSSDIIKSIAIEHPTFKVDLYDNGDIDGDSVSLFYNGKLLLSHKKLSDKAISLTLDVSNTGKEINELTMYADNLGTIPPNTALMVVTDGDKRYEVRISSDLKKSGTIRFTKSQ